MTPDDPQFDDTLKMHAVICADQMLGRDGLIRLHALNLAVGQRREVFRVNRRDDEEQPYDGEFAREALVDARLYAAWLGRGDEGEADQ
jgi:hypothetical protein